MNIFTQRLVRMMVGGALVAALIMAVQHGATKGSNFWLAVALVIGLCCVAIGEFVSWHNMAHAFHERQLFSCMLWASLGVLLSAGTLYTNFSTSAGNNDTKAGISKAAMTHQSDMESTEAELTKRNNDLLQRLEMAPKRTAEAAEAAIQNAKAHRWWDVTNGCTETKGKQTRAFCDAYASAVADKAGATQLLVDREEQKMVAKQLQDVRGQRGSIQQAVMGDDQPAVRFIAAKLGMDKAEARQVDSMVLPFLVQAMLLFGGILLANEAFRGRDRKPWIDVDRWLHRLAVARDIVSGKAKLPDVPKAEVLAPRRSEDNKSTATALVPNNNRETVHERPVVYHSLGSIRDLVQTLEAKAT